MIKFRPGLYYNESNNILCLVYKNFRCVKMYLGGGSKLMDKNLSDDTWYEGFVLPRTSDWEFVCDI